MLGTCDLKAQDAKGLGPDALAALAARKRHRIHQQNEQLALEGLGLQRRLGEIGRNDREMVWRDALL